MEGVLHIEGLSKYFGSKKVLDNISLDAYRGEVLGLLGPNGAGKTTAIKIVMGFLRSDSGKITVDGMDLRKNYEKCMAQLGGIVENPEMYRELSGRVNLEMYARLHDNVTKERIDQVVHLVGMEARINDKIKKYSLGMKQRIGLAQALLHRPSVLIMDEPTNGLDPTGIKELRDIFRKLAHEENIAVIVSSHMLAEMEQMCDRVAVIDKGRILMQKPISEFIKDISGNNSYRFYVDDPDAAIRALTELGSQCDMSLGDSWFDICCIRDSLPDVTRYLVSRGIRVYEVNLIEHSLEEAFITLVGGGHSIV